jgi:hypothetical protein
MTQPKLTRARAVIAAVLAAALTGKVPAAGTVCQPEGPPFTPPPATLQETTSIGPALNAVAVPPAARQAMHAH